MAKVFAVTVILIAIGSAIPILMHKWVPPVDISTHGPLIDEQLSETMVEAGISFLAAQFILGLFVWKYSNTPKSAKIRNFPGGATGLVTAAVLLVGLEAMALGVLAAIISTYYVAIYALPGLIRVARRPGLSGAGQRIASTAG